MRDAASGNVITEGFFYVGAEVTFHGHCFRITMADDKTLRLMEERAAAPGGFVHSDPVKAAENLGGWVDGRAEEVRAFLRERDPKVRVGGRKEGCGGWRVGWRGAGGPGAGAESGGGGGDVEILYTYCYHL